MKMPVDDIARTKMCVLVPPAGQGSPLGIQDMSSSFAVPFYGWLVFARPPSTRTLQFRYKSKERFSYIPPVFNFVNENTGYSLKLRWLRHRLRLPSAGLALRREEGLACERISYFRSRRKTSDVNVPTVRREWTGNQALFSGHGNSVRHVTVSVLLGSGCFRHSDVARVRGRWDRSRSW